MPLPPIAYHSLMALPHSAPVNDAPLLPPQSWYEASVDGLPWLRRCQRRVFPEIVNAKEIDTRVQGTRLFSGTSLAALERVIDESHGALNPTLTFFSNVAGLSYDYARTRGLRDKSPGVVLFIKKDTIETRVEEADYQPYVENMMGHQCERIATFFQASATIYLAEFDASSFSSIENWIRGQRERSPHLRGYWDDKLAKFSPYFA
ncbi:MAG: hypothetical protein HQM16_00295 [Deltaproteobacteria bacterium]|nr:hypothetical protein [Deltaproteobacteria bacterium]